MRVVNIKGISQTRLIWGLQKSVHIRGSKIGLNKIPIRKFVRSPDENATISISTHDAIQYEIRMILKTGFFAGGLRL